MSCQVLHALQCSGMLWYRVMSCHFMAPRVVSCRVMSCHIMYLVLCSVYINGCTEVIIKFIYDKRILTNGKNR